jgi:phospholipase/carboxylesterase
LPDAVFISPDAPFPCDMVPHGYPDSYQWFSLQRRDAAFIKNGIETAFPVLSAFIDGLLETYKLSPAHLALVGFSQGTMMSLYAAPRYTGGCVAGVVGYSGALYGAEDLSLAAHRPPVCLIHGQADDVVPVSAYHHAKEALEKAGFTVSGHTTPYLTHSIDERGINEGGNFLKSVLSA